MTTFHLEYEPGLLSIENGPALRHGSTDPALVVSLAGRPLDSPINAFSPLSRFALEPKELEQAYGNDEHERAVIDKLTKTSPHAHMANVLHAAGPFAATTAYFYDASAGNITMERRSHTHFGDGSMPGRTASVPLHETLYYNFGRGEPSGIATLRYTTNDLHMIRNARELDRAQRAGGAPFHRVYAFAKTVAFLAGNLLAAPQDIRTRKLLDPEAETHPSISFKTPALAGLHRVLLRQRGGTQPTPKLV